MSDENEKISMVDRIRNRSLRATVPERDTSFVEITEGVRVPPAAPASVPKALPGLEGLPETAPRRQIRLIVDLDAEIETFCNQHTITIETYLEALHLACKDNPTLQEAVVTDAKTRLADRKKAGKIRRLHTQLKQKY